MMLVEICWGAQLMGVKGDVFYSDLQFTGYFPPSATEATFKCC